MEIPVWGAACLRQRWLIWCSLAMGPLAGAAWGQAVTFTVAPAYAVGSSTPAGLAAGDFNGDGKLDLVVANRDSTSVSILLNNGSGGFRPPLNYLAGSLPQSVVVADFNGDGKADFAVANTGSNSVWIYLGNGDGTFQAPSTAYAGVHPQFVTTIVDYFSSKLDLVVADYGDAVGAGGGISQLISNGDGTFQPGVLLPAGNGTVSVVVGDFNHDSILDLAAANAVSNNVSVLLGNVANSFQPPVNYNTSLVAAGGNPTSIVVGDLNGDGRLDLAVTSPALYDVAVLLGYGNGQFQAPVHYPLDYTFPGSSPSFMTIGDLNGDNKLDLVVANTNADRVSVLMGNGAGAYSSVKSYAAGAAPRAAVIGDFNGDGKLDLAVTNSGSGNVSVLFGNGDGTFQAAPLYRTDKQAESIVAADLNGDGKLDVVVATSYAGTVVPILGNGNGTFQTGVKYSTGGQTTSVAVGDFNGDKKLDLVTADNVGTYSVILGNGDGTFQAPVIYNYTSGTTPHSVAVGDFNGDGKLDLAFANKGSDNVSVWLGKGDGTFVAFANYATPPGGSPYYIVAADLNGDGKLDLAVTNSGLANVSVLLGNGDGSFQPAINYPVASSPHSILVADFNGDGKPDLATANSADGSVSVLLGNGNGSFQPALTYPAGSAPETVATGDFNGDGKLDLSVTSNSGVSLLFGNGDGTMRAAVNYTTPVGRVVVGDFNRDGRPDLVVADWASDTVAVLLNTSTIAEPVTVTSSPPGLSATIDSAATPCTTPCNLMLNWMSAHTIAVTSPENTAGGHFMFQSWSDGGAISHSIVIASAATYTATFSAQYLLTVATVPEGTGTVTGSPVTADGYYNSGTSVQLTANANPGMRFAGWSGDLSGTDNPKSITMNAAHSVTANFLSGAPAVIGVQPPSGSGPTHTFTYQFSHSGGAQNLSVLDVLINNFLDGRNACYLAYVVATSTLVLLDDAGDAGGPYAGSVTGSNSTVIQNSQCAVSLSLATAGGTNFTLILNVAFKSGFAGNRIQYLAARDVVQTNTNWQAMGVWNVPSSSPPTGTIAVASMSPARGAAAAGTAQTLTVTLSDGKGAADIGIVNILVNNFIDGRSACYLAYVASGKTLLLVDDAGDAGGPFAGSMVLNGSAGSIQNSQCSVSGAGSSVSLTGTVLSLTLNITFKAALTGNRIAFVAGRDTAGLNNTDWQASGTFSVQ
ncbi:MAG TPA: FG-GAP-like repeat-containing protein [Bryobacteraceae bacterium]|nr:FG-GAP-like repeat-containing protein [Bryobacteraceae bacterium]